MQEIGIHLAEMAGWRALLTKAQFVAKLELHTVLEEYLVGMLFRTVGTPSPGQGSKTMECLHNVADQTSNDAKDLRTIGDHCLLFAGLFPEQAAGKNLPIAYFVEVGQAAYREFGQVVEDPMFWMLAEHFVDTMDVLQTLREVENENICIDPLDAYQLWHDTGSAHAWQILQRFTSALPGCEASAALH
jgi:hypothetical protein